MGHHKSFGASTTRRSDRNNFKKLEIPLGVGVSGVPRFIRMTALFFIIGIFP
jgi:hypothetical protein